MLVAITLLALLLRDSSLTVSIGLFALAIGIGLVLALVRNEKTEAFGRAVEACWTSPWR